MTEHTSKKGGARVRFPPPLVYVGLVGTGVAIQRWLLPITIGGGWARIGVGSVIVVSGLLVLLAALLWFKKTGQHPAPWEPSPELIAHGIYQRTRNPMYVGMTLCQLGIGVAVDNFWIAALAPIGLATVHVIAVLPEERYLSEKFGEAYLRYKASVRRYL